LALASEGTRRATERRIWFLGNLMTIKHGLGEGHRSTFIEGDLQEGHAPPLHVHQHETESFYIVSGTVRFRVGEDEFERGPSDFVYVPEGTAHAFKVGSGGARMLMMSTSPLLARFMAEGGANAAGSQRPIVSEEDFNRVVALAPRHDMMVVGPPLQ
jgi:mannose-6-phosphate isomerase-like protein (cupin superfamily)